MLDELGCGDIPRITVFNKIDLDPTSAAAAETIPVQGVRQVFISAAEKRGIDRLMNMISDCLSESVTTVQLLIPYQNGGLTDYIRKEGSILREEYTENGVRTDATVPKRSLFRYQDYLITPESQNQ